VSRTAPEEPDRRALGLRVGELLIFDDQETRLTAIDRLEGLHHGGPPSTAAFWSLNRANGSGLPVWLYAVGDRWIGSFKELTGGIRR
jgi:hypothetical protein